MKTFLQSLSRDKRGNVAMTFALALTPLVVLGGSATDFSYAFMERDRAQDALDRATLAGAKNLGLIPTSQVQSQVQQLFSDFYQPSSGTTVSAPTVVIDGSAGKVTANVTMSTNTAFMPLLDIHEITAQIASQAKMGNYDFDVVMVLDTSGSMAGSKISTLKTAANNLSATLLNMNTVGGRTDRVQLGIVPFSGAVNVGPSYGPTYSGTKRTSDGTGAAWLDVKAASPIHNENWNSGLTANRFDLYAKLANAYSSYASKLNWAGCVEMRPYPYSVDDTTPTSATPATLFVPMFAPDEAGYKSGSYWTNYSDNNNYLSDDAGSCSGLPSYSNSTGKLEGQGRICKYDAPATSKFQNASSLGTTWGPNYYCRSQPILPLTFDSTSITNKVNALTAEGNTNILEGVAWGSRVLSPAAPFTEGRTGTTDRPLQKVMIVMTDGENTYGTDTSNYNLSSYGPYGFLRKNRLQLASINSTTVKDKQDALTLEACANAKAAGTTVYTVAFTVTSTSTKTMLQTCATSANYAYAAENNADLLAVFQTIANQISRLRIAA
jgi:Flp pilus assembly protein TadG